MASHPVAQVRTRRPLRERITTRIAHFTFLLSRPMTLGVRGVVMNERGEVMLVKHTYVSGWHFPGGGVESGETCELALVRELAEEANIVVEGAPKLHGLFFNRAISRRDHVAVYFIDRFRQTGERAPDREIVAAKFFARDALPAER